MQTFLPHLTYARSVAVLDRQRLGKQRVEAIQILSVLLERKWIHETAEFAPMPMELLGWSSHPAVRMWSGHEGALYKYLMEACREWTDRGYKDSVRDRAKDHLRPLIQEDAWTQPNWHNEQFCSAHRSILLAKDPHYYSSFGWKESPAERDSITNRWPYPWPVSTRTNPS